MSYTDNICCNSRVNVYYSFMLQIYTSLIAGVMYYSRQYTFKTISTKPRSTWFLCSNTATHTHAYHLITDSLFDNDTSLEMGERINCMLWFSELWLNNFKGMIFSLIKEMSYSWLFHPHLLVSASSLFFIFDALFIDSKRTTFMRSLLQRDIVKL